MEEEQEGRGNPQRRSDLNAVIRYRHIALFLIAAASVAAFTGRAFCCAPGGRDPQEQTLPDPSRGDLQRLIDAAPPGSLLSVPAGRYEGNIVLSHRLILVGDGKPVIHGDGQGSVITVTGDSCQVRGFVVEHSGTMLVDEDAGILLKSSGNTIEENELRDVLFGIYLYQSERNAINGNRIAGRSELELGERGSGIHIWNSRFNRFTDNTITDARDGFYIQNASNTWIERNEVYGVRYGLHYMYADSNVFLRNSFHHNVAGAAVMYSRDIKMRGNVFSHNRGFASFGILFQDCHNLLADSNIVADNQVGMFLEASTGNLFRRNVIALNDVAFEMFQNSTDNTFTENNFLDNLSPLTLVGKQTGSNWSDGARGNYWSSYDGYDLDGDGLGDLPMKIQNVFQYLEGRNPNARLYLYSPASQALAAAGKAFPVIQINEETDLHPLMRPMNLTSVRSAGTGYAGGGGVLILLPLAAFASAGLLYRRLAKRSWQ